jgi:hypothetical protein
MSEFAQGKERRREHRAKIARPVYMQGADAAGVQFEELRTTRDLGRWGFYFVTERDSYRVGMVVQAIPAFGCLNCEYEGEVVRVEKLPAGEYGVAVHLLSVLDAAPVPDTVTRSTFESFARADAPLWAAHAGVPR